MKKLLLLYFILFQISNQSICQTKNILWFTPSKSEKINGLSIGLIESTIFQKNNLQQTINGLSINIVGTGLLTTAFVGSMPYESIFEKNVDYSSIEGYLTFFDSILIHSNIHSYRNNGITISLTGSLIDNVNGILIGGCTSGITEMNGLLINPIMNLVNTLNGIQIGALNENYQVNGLQIGIFNRTVKLKGIQIGLWNKSLHRSLPFINWGNDKITKKDANNTIWY
jgi:hypothetical protein